MLVKEDKSISFLFFYIIQLVVRGSSVIIYLNWLNVNDNLLIANSYTTFTYLLSLTLNIFTYGTFSLRYIHGNLIWSVKNSGYGAWIIMTSLFFISAFFLFDIISLPYLPLIFLNMLIYEMTIIQIQKDRKISTQIFINYQLFTASIAMVMNIFFKIDILWMLYFFQIVLLIFYANTLKYLVLELFDARFNFRRLIVFMKKFKLILLNNFIGLIAWTIVPLIFRSLYFLDLELLIKYETLLKIMLLIYTVSSIFFTQLHLSNLLKGRSLILYSTFYFIASAPIIYFFHDDIFSIFQKLNIVKDSTHIKAFFGFALLFGNILILLNLQRILFIRENKLNHLNFTDLVTMLVLICFSFLVLDTLSNLIYLIFGVLSFLVLFLHARVYRYT
jgi:hypothetical protein